MSTDRRLTAPRSTRLGRRWAVLVMAAGMVGMPVAGHLTAAASAVAAVPTGSQMSAARITDERQVSARVLELTITTNAFTGPTKVMVDLPVGYGTAVRKRWPVTYYLAGTDHRYKDFNEQYGGVRLSAAYPSLVVSPNGDSGYWSDWFNNGEAGPPKYETFVVDQLIPLIDQRFRTTRSRAGRAVLGESMGGYGAMMLAARHPDLFAAASSLSGAVDSNLPANGAALSASPLLQGAFPDAVYGPRATQEVRWRGHNPTDLASNLRTVAVQIRSATGVLAPAIGETAADAAGCGIEAAVDMATTDLHAALLAQGIPHLYERYPTGCHSVPNFQRQITETFQVFAKQLRAGSIMPKAFSYRTVEPTFDVFGWSVRADRDRALEFLELRTDGRSAFTVNGSGSTSVMTPALFRPGQRVAVTGATARTAVADMQGRVRLTVDLGPPHGSQQYTPGAATSTTRRQVTLSPR